MKLIVNKDTNYIINNRSLIDGDLESINLLNSWKDNNNNIIYPNNCNVFDVDDNLYNFSNDETGDGYTNTYYYINNNIVLKKEIEPNYVKQLIENLKIELTESDYKIIKCYESQLINETSEYNITELHQSRQLIRDKINTLKNLISQNND